MRVLCYDTMNSEKSMPLLNNMKKSEGWSIIEESETAVGRVRLVELRG